MKEEKLLKLFREIFTEVPTNEIVLDAELRSGNSTVHLQ